MADKPKPAGGKPKPKGGAPAEPKPSRTLEILFWVLIALFPIKSPYKTGKGDLETDRTFFN